MISRLSLWEHVNYKSSYTVIEYLSYLFFYFFFLFFLLAISIFIDRIYIFYWPDSGTDKTS